MATYGNFVDGVARLTGKGGQNITKDSRSFTDTYTVTLSAGQRPTASGAVSGVPKVGDEWADNNAYTVQSVNWNNTPPSLVWTADVEYSKSKVNQSQEEDPPPSGVKLVMRDWSTRSATVDLEFDRGIGTSIANTAGDRFQDALTTEEFLPTITIKTHESEHPAQKIMTYTGRINEEDVTVAGIEIPAHCGLLTINASETESEEYPFDLTYTVEIRNNPHPTIGTFIYGDVTFPASGWDRPMGYDEAIANVGYRFKNETSGTERFLDVTPEGGYALAVDPHMLNVSGGSAASGEIFWKVVQKYPSVDWSDLWLPRK